MLESNILIPTYTSAESNPTNAILLNALYHVAIVACNSFAIEPYDASDDDS